MKTMTDMIRYLLLGAVCISLLNSCAEEENFMENPADNVPVPLSGELYLSLKLSLDENGGMTRNTAGSNDEITRPGVNNESAIHMVYLFFEDVNNEGTSEEKKPKIWFRVPFPGVAPDGTVTLKIYQGGSKQLTTGTKNVYLGANLSPEQARCFAEGNKEYAVQENEDNNYSNLVEKYAPGRGIGLVEPTNGDNSRNNIAMFCTEGKSLILNENDDTYKIDGLFELKRNVAKILVTCKVAESEDLVEGAEQDVEYCVLTNGLKGRGWIRQDNVRFLVNGLNLKSYVMERAQWLQDPGIFYYKDPNDNLQDNISVGPDGVNPVPQFLRDNFLYHATQTLNQQSRFYVKTLPYEESRMPNGFNDETCYHEGLYCPENTFDLSLTDEATKVILANYNYAWPMITHVSITAKFTPKDLLVEKEMATYIDRMNVKEMPELTPEMKATIQELIKEGKPHTTLPNSIVRVSSPSEAVSGAILTASLKHYNMLQPGSQGYDEKGPGFPENTYLSVVDEQGETEFYTYGAARTIAEGLGKWQEGDDPKKLASFKAMPRGRGYYYTYVDNRKATDKPGVPPTYADGQVERNVYYILTVDAFATPGRTGSEPEYIKVHTRVEAWKDGGSANIELN